MKIIFFGSDDFAAIHLQHLLKEEGHDILCCVTGPDKQQGRGMRIASSPIKQIAAEHHISCLQPLSLKESFVADTLKSFKADIFVVVAYGRLLPQAILDIPKMLCMNVHGSLLPKYRGAAPVNWAILNGEKETGVTIQKMAFKLDAGDIIAQEVISIDDDENAAQLRERMALAGAKLLVKVLKEYPLGQFSLSPQDETLTTWAPKLTKEMGKIDWGSQSRSIMNQVRGLQPWPGAYTFYNGKMLKIIQVGTTTEGVGNCTPGQVVKIDRNGFYVACLDKCLLIKELQPTAGKVMHANSFVAGYKISQGSLLSPS
ncbi:MAG: methionyl-tRNA formyltransferase [Candidatus Omnitrophica bacterium]|nr:methionyl-tRNA formyltransferase [Candidatus Omnitrophota bacterium]